MALLGPPESTPQTASQSAEPFQHSSWLCPTKTHADRLRDIDSNTPHLCGLKRRDPSSWTVDLMTATDCQFTLYSCPTSYLLPVQFDCISCVPISDISLLQTPRGHLTAFCLTFWRSAFIITLVLFSTVLYRQSTWILRSGGTKLGKL